MVKAALIIAPLIAVAMPASATTYGDTLVSDFLKIHENVVGLSIAARSSKGALLEAAAGRATGKAEERPLLNSLGQPIGTVKISLRHGSGADEAGKMAAQLARQIYTADNLGEPDPFVAGGVRSSRGQALVNQAMAQHGHLVTLAMHVALPGRENQIIASNFGRIGKAADKDDAHVIADGAVLKEVTNGGQRMAIELPMTGAKGSVIGALSTSFGLSETNTADAAMAEAIQVRDEIAHGIPSVDALRP